MHPVRTFFHEFEWIHIGLGILGNLSFALGSLLFLRDATTPIGVWFFVVGSTGMLIGSVGNAVVKLGHGEVPGRQAEASARRSR